MRNGGRKEWRGVAQAVDEYIKLRQPALFRLDRPAARLRLSSLPPGANMILETKIYCFQSIQHADVTLVDILLTTRHAFILERS